MTFHRVNESYDDDVMKVIGRYLCVNSEFEDVSNVSKFDSMNLHEFTYMSELCHEHVCYDSHDCNHRV